MQYRIVFTVRYTCAPTDTDFIGILRTYIIIIVLLEFISLLYTRE